MRKLALATILALSPVALAAASEVTPGFTAVAEGEDGKLAPRMYRTEIAGEVYHCVADANQRHRCYSGSQMLAIVRMIPVDFEGAIIEQFDK